MNELPEPVARALSEDLAQLLRLHRAELDGPTLAALADAGFPAGLALQPPGADRVMAEIRAALEAGPGLDALAADYAALYLTGAWGACPEESEWLGEDRLRAGQPLFDWLEILGQAGLAPPPGWHGDHLVCQLGWLAARLSRPGTDLALLARVLDQHLLRWLPAWNGRLQARERSACLYTGLAGLTLAWLEALRQILAEGYALPRQPRFVLADADKPDSVSPLRFMPGMREGW